MFLTVDDNDKRPLYQQVVDGVKALIACGDLHEGMTLPSVRQVAGDLGVNLNTIAVAYRQLQDEGFLNVRHGSGAVVLSRRERSVREQSFSKPLRTALTDLILAGLSDPEILTMVQQELEILGQKGASR
jgi:GntR family transcriptional regulator